MSIDAVDRKIIEATQAGHSLAPRPYHDVAGKLGLEPEEVMPGTGSTISRPTISSPALGSPNAAAS